MPQDVREIGKTIQSAMWGPYLFAVLSTLVGIYLGMFVPSLLAGNQQTSSATEPLASASAVLAVSSTCSVPTVTPTITINLTSTKTIKLAPEEASNVAAPFGGFLSDRAQSATAESEVKKTSCSIEIYSSNEILVKVPSGSKTAWLAKGAIDIDVWRGKELLKSKLSTTDEGILIAINRKDAYGVMNVSVVTARRPKINETFAVNFGKPTIVEVFEAGSSFLRSIAKTVAEAAEDTVSVLGNSYSTRVAFGVEMLQDQLGSLSDQLKEARDSAQGYSSRITMEMVNRAKGSLGTNAVHKMLKKARDEVAERLWASEDLRDGMEISLLRAQITSKLWWLKIRGRTAEHTNYAAKASEFLKQKEQAVRDKVDGKFKAKGVKRWWIRNCPTSKLGRAGKWMMGG